MKEKILFICFFLLTVSIASCKNIHPTDDSSTPITHELWDELLKKYVNEEGWVNYKGFLEDRDKLSDYLRKLEENVPNEEHWSREEQLAYWINAYNAYTVELILTHYPVKSIKDIGSRIQVPFVNSPWDIKFIEFGEESYDLNNIEHDILRKKYNEPRIHFAIVCAAYSCPALLNKAYTADKLDDQLTRQTMLFLNDPTKNKFKANKAQISSIFKWFEEDFTKNGTVIDFINQYIEEKIDKRARISYMDYDWRLNEE